MCLFLNPFFLLRFNVDWYFKDPVQTNYWHPHILYRVYFQFGIFNSTL